MKKIILSIPCKYNNLTQKFEIPSLGLKFDCKTEKNGLKLLESKLSDAFNQTFSTFLIEKIIPLNINQIEDEFERFIIMIDNYDKILEKILILQPLIETGIEEEQRRKKEKIEKGSLLLAKADEILDYGYPEWDL